MILNFNIIKGIGTIDFPTEILCFDIGMSRNNAFLYHRFTFANVHDWVTYSYLISIFKLNC